MPSHLDLYSDTDWAGCPITRRSSSGIALKFGTHLWLFASTTQVPIALSSGEAEFYGAVKGASRLLGAAALARDLGLELQCRLFGDSSAARGVLARRGCGKIRHIETQTLWVQKATQDKKLWIGVVLGTKNPADLGTKHLEAATIARLCASLNLKVETGIADGSLRAMV